jgi:hypothetical protein
MLATRSTRAAVVVAIAALAGAALTPALSTIRSHLPAMPASHSGPARVPLNGKNGATLTLPDGEQRLVHSLLNITRPMRFGDYVWNDSGIPAGRPWVRVDLGRQTISVFRAGHEIGTAVIMYGADIKQTPIGVFPVLDRFAQHRSNLYDADMPYTLRLTNDGVAIHASNVREGYATHGCIGVPLAFARLLFGRMQRGDLVAILPATGTPSRRSARS